MSKKAAKETKSTEFAKESNRYTGKGPGRLDFYCDACRRQCGDRLGYERHCHSKIHLDRVAQIEANPEQYLQENSDQFEDQFLSCLKLRAGEPVEMNTIYQDVVHIKDHVHMKGTKWTTLTEFVRYLDATKKCKVDYVTGQGWFLTYVETDAGLIFKNQFANARRALLANAVSSKSKEFSNQFRSNSNQSDDWDTPSDRPQLSLDKDNFGVSVNINLDIAKRTGAGLVRSTQKQLGPTGKKSLFDGGDDDDDDSSSDTNDAGNGINPISATELVRSNPNNQHNTNQQSHTTQQSGSLDDPPLPTLPQKRKAPDSSPFTPHSTHSNSKSDQNNPDKNDPTTTSINPTNSGPQLKPKSQFKPRWIKKPRTSHKSPWIRKGLVVKITNDKLDSGKYYGYKGIITNIFTSMNKKLIPIDLKYKKLPTLSDDSIKPQRNEIGQDDDDDDDDDEDDNDEDDDDEEDVVITTPDGIDICVDYSYTIVAEVTIQIESNEQGATISKKILLPQTDLQTTLPKEHELETEPIDDNGENSRGCRSGLQRGSNGTEKSKRIVAVVAGDYSNPDVDTLLKVKIIRLGPDSYQAKVQLHDQWYKTLQYTDNSLVQLENWYELTMSPNSNQDHKAAQTIQPFNKLDQDIIQDSLYESTVWLSYDDLCMIDDEYL